jgi:hypothetical protein
MFAFPLVWKRLYLRHRQDAEALAAFLLLGAPEQELLCQSYLLPRGLRAIPTIDP